MIRTITTAVVLGCVTMLATPVTAQADDALEPFLVHLDRASQSSDIIPAILAAGHDQLVTACEQTPGASVRIMNPLASGDYADVACLTILDGGESVGQSSDALMSGGERVGQTQQKWSPIGLGCSFVMLGLGIFMNHAICKYPGAENPNACAALSEFGMGGSASLARSSAGIQCRGRCD